MDIDRLFEDKRIVITCGAGGVGKTTSAAAIACRAAQTGRKVAVLTVDPARRLASSLGMREFQQDGSVVEIPGENGEEASRMDAMMLDVRSTYDRLVQRYATSPEQVEGILNNKFYRHFSGAVGGSHEYTAMERLYELVEQKRWDLLVLDTPPTVHALDFLDAPQRLIDAFDESIFRWVITPYLMAGKVGVQVLSFGSAYIFKTLTRFAGGQMIEDLSEYLRLFQGMFEGFRDRARAVQKLLHDSNTHFVVVATPQPNSLQDAALFHRELARMDLPFGGFLINRAMPPLPELFSLEQLQQNFSGTTNDSGLLNRLVESQNNYQLAAERQQQRLQRFLSGIDPAPTIYRAPLFEQDVSDVSGLLALTKLVSVERN